MASFLHIARLFPAVNFDDVTRGWVSSPCTHFDLIGHGATNNIAVILRTHVPSCFRLSTILPSNIVVRAKITLFFFLFNANKMGHKK